jgi:N-methylhydantoinase B
MEGLTSGEPMRAGEVVRIRTTGGGGWGDPLDRDPQAVLRDVVQGKVSRAMAERDYGVAIATAVDPPATMPPTAYAVVTGTGEEHLVVDEDQTRALRARLRADRGPRPFFDRGPGYARLADGATHADVDELSATERAALDRGSGSGGRVSRDSGGGSGGRVSRDSGGGSGRHPS